MISNKVMIVEDSQAENIIRCQRIEPNGLTYSAEEDYDGPNVLSCEKCDARYALFLRMRFAENFETLWEQWVKGLRAAVTEEHHIGHPTAVFFHDGTIVPLSRGNKRFGRWLRS